MKPIRVLLEKDGKPYGSVTTYPAGWAPPDVGEFWEEDKKHVVVSGRPGTGDATHDEVILTIKENPRQPGLDCGIRRFQPKLDNSQTQHFVTKADRSENEALA
jgi:hypothetical protein